MKRGLIGILLIGLVIVSSYIPKNTVEKKVDYQFVRGQVVVGFENKTVVETLKKMYNLRILYKDEKLKFAVVKVPEGKEIEIINKVKDDPGIRYAEPDYILHADFIPDDPYWEKQWGPIRIKCPEAWDRCTGNKNVVIAILDTGVDYNHEDLSANMWHNPGEIPNNGIDDDGNGYVDDYYGWDFVHNESDPSDNYGHGTHCAGISAAVINNGIGIAGVTQARIMAVKIAEGNLTTDSLLSIGIRYAVDNGADIISISYNGYGSNKLKEACDYAWSQGVILVASAGNDGKPTVSYPAAFDTVIAVGAVDSDGKLCEWSNYGEKLELVAPGEGILSTWPGNEYKFLSGTSMAAPHVAGVAALAKAMFPDYTNQQIRDLLDISADDLGRPGRDDCYGYGIVDATFNDKNTSTPMIRIKVHEVKAIDRIDPPWDQGAEWYYIIRVISGEKEEIVMNLNADKLPFRIKWHHEDDWRVDKIHILPTYDPQVQIKIRLMDHDTLGDDDVADISSSPSRKEFVMFYDMIKNTILPGSDEVKAEGGWLVTSGDFDGSTNIDENDAEIWFTISDNYDPPKPDLEASGNLEWNKVKPGETVKGEIYIWNAGEPDPYGWCDNNLNWSIASYPEWGKWSFSRKEGYGLKPEDGKIKIDVSVTAPYEGGEIYTGKIKIIDVDDPSDYKFIDVSLKTVSSSGPSISIVTPEEGNLYVMGVQIIHLPFGWTVIMGPITIRAEVHEVENPVVNFYIDGELRLSDPIPPFEYPWWDTSFGLHLIKVEVTGQGISDTVKVFKIF